MRRALLISLPILLIAAVASGLIWLLPGPDGRKEGSKPSPAPLPARGCRPGTLSLGSSRAGVAAFVVAPVAVHRRPGGATTTTLEPKRASFSRSNRAGVPTVVSVLSELRARSCRATWYHVLLPGRGGTRSGFVRAAALKPFRVRTRIVVDLSSRRLTLFESGRPLIKAPVAVGAPATPTPRGRFYVVERIRVTDSGGPYGAAALALSAFSPKLTNWPDGGPVAIHGTNEPASIGEAASHGCIRLGARDLLRVFARAGLGTPVSIVS